MKVLNLTFVDGSIAFSNFSDVQVWRHTKVTRALETTSVWLISMAVMGHSRPQNDLHTITTDCWDHLELLIVYWTLLHKFKMFSGKYTAIHLYLSLWMEFKIIKHLVWSISPTWRDLQHKLKLRYNCLPLKRAASWVKPFNLLRILSFFCSAITFQTSKSTSEVHTIQILL